MSVPFLILCGTPGTFLTTEDEGMAKGILPAGVSTIDTVTCLSLMMDLLFNRLRHKMSIRYNLRYMLR